MSQVVTRRLMRIDPGQAGKIAGLLYFVMGVIGGCVMIVAGLVAPTGGGFMIGFGILAPLIYGALGMFFGMITTLVFNWAAGRTGGLGITITQTEV